MSICKTIANRIFASVLQQGCAGCCAETSIELCRGLRNESCMRSPEEDAHIWEEITDVLPNPGHPDAIKIGCACSHFHNDHGMGAHGTFDASQSLKVFYIEDACPLHGVGTQWLIDYTARGHHK